MPLFVAPQITIQPNSRSYSTRADRCSWRCIVMARPQSRASSRRTRPTTTTTTTQTSLAPSPHHSPSASTASTASLSSSSMISNHHSRQTRPSIRSLPSTSTLATLLIIAFLCCCCVFPIKTTAGISYLRTPSLYGLGGHDIMVFTIPDGMFGTFPGLEFGYPVSSSIPAADVCGLYRPLENLSDLLHGLPSKESKCYALPDGWTTWDTVDLVSIMRNSDAVGLMMARTMSECLNADDVDYWRTTLLFRPLIRTMAPGTHVACPVYLAIDPAAPNNSKALKLTLQLKNHTLNLPVNFNPLFHYSFITYRPLHRGLISWNPATRTDLIAIAISAATPGPFEFRIVPGLLFPSFTDDVTFSTVHHHLEADDFYCYKQDDVIYTPDLPPSQGSPLTPVFVSYSFRPNAIKRGRVYYHPTRNSYYIHIMHQHSTADEPLHCLLPVTAPLTQSNYHVVVAPGHMMSADLRSQSNSVYLMTTSGFRTDETLTPQQGSNDFPTRGVVAINFNQPRFIPGYLESIEEREAAELGKDGSLTSWSELVRAHEGARRSNKGTYRQPALPINTMSSPPGSLFDPVYDHHGSTLQVAMWFSVGEGQMAPTPPPLLSFYPFTLHPKTNFQTRYRLFLTAITYPSSILSTTMTSRMGSEVVSFLRQKVTDDGDGAHNDDPISTTDTTVESAVDNHFRTSDQTVVVTERFYTHQQLTSSLSPNPDVVQPLSSYIDMVSSSHGRLGVTKYNDAGPDEKKNPKNQLFFDDHYTILDDNYHWIINHLQYPEFPIRPGSQDLIRFEHTVPERLPSTSERINATHIKYTATVNRLPQANLKFCLAHMNYEMYYTYAKMYSKSRLDHGAVEAGDEQECFTIRFLPTFSMEKLEVKIAPQTITFEDLSPIDPVYKHTRQVLERAYEVSPDGGDRNDAFDDINVTTAHSTERESVYKRHEVDITARLEQIGSYFNDHPFVKPTTSKPIPPLQQQFESLRENDAITSPQTLSEDDGTATTTDATNLPIFRDGHYDSLYNPDPRYTNTAQRLLYFHTMNVQSTVTFPAIAGETSLQVAFSFNKPIHFLHKQPQCNVFLRNVVYDPLPLPHADDQKEPFEFSDRFQDILAQGSERYSSAVVETLSDTKKAKMTALETQLLLSPIYNDQGNYFFNSDNFTIPAQSKVETVIDASYLGPDALFNLTDFEIPLEGDDPSALLNKSDQLNLDEKSWKARSTAAKQQSSHTTNYLKHNYIINGKIYKQQKISSMAAAAAAQNAALNTPAPLLTASTITYLDQLYQPHLRISCDVHIDNYQAIGPGAEFELLFRLKDSPNWAKRTFSLPEKPPTSPHYSTKATVVEYATKVSAPYHISYSIHTQHLIETKAQLKDVLDLSLKALTTSNVQHLAVINDPITSTSVVGVAQSPILDTSVYALDPSQISFAIKNKNYAATSKSRTLAPDPSGQSAVFSPVNPLGTDIDDNFVQAKGFSRAPYYAASVQDLTTTGTFITLFLNLTDPSQHRIDQSISGNEHLNTIAGDFRFVYNSGVDTVALETAGESNSTITPQPPSSDPFSPIPSCSLSHWLSQPSVEYLNITQYHDGHWFIPFATMLDNSTHHHDPTTTKSVLDSILARIDSHSPSPSPSPSPLSSSSSKRAAFSWQHLEADNTDLQQPDSSPMVGLIYSALRERTTGTKTYPEAHEIKSYFIFHLHPFNHGLCGPTPVAGESCDLHTQCRNSICHNGRCLLSRDYELFFDRLKVWNRNFNDQLTYQLSQIRKTSGPSSTSFMTVGDEDTNDELNTVRVGQYFVSLPFVPDKSHGTTPVLIYALGLCFIIFLSLIEL